jgi:SAM-dependent methyltransferase
MNNRNFTKLLEKHFSHLSDEKKALHIKINTDISRFDVWTDQVNQIKTIKNSTILSSGCGTGGDIYYFLQKKAKKVYGIETSPGLAKLAKNRLSVFKPTSYKIDIYDGNILPYSDNKFDIIFSMHVLEHTVKPYLYLDEIIRVTKRSGIIYLELPNKIYPKEQHTHQMIIHWFPLKLRKILINLKLYKPGYDLNSFLTPYQLYYHVKKNTKVQILESFLHSYDGDNIKFTFFHFSFKFLYKLFKKTTYKIVIKKL